MRSLLVFLFVVMAAAGRSQGPKLRFTHLSGEQGLSNSTIEAIFQDSQGFIWIGTRDGLNRYDGHEMVVYRDDSLTDSYIKCIYEDHLRRLWVGTANGLCCLDRGAGRWVRYKHLSGNVASLSSNAITSILEDRAGRLWVATYGGGLDRFAGSSGFVHYNGADRILCLHEDRSGRLWVGTATGLMQFEAAAGRFVAVANPAITNPSGNTIISIQEDRQGNLWLGTEDDGIFLFDPLHRSFTRYGHSDREPSSLGNNMIKCMLTDHKGQLWAGSINGGLNLFHGSTGSFFHYSYEPGNGASLSQRTISALFEDRQGNLWVGTHRGGINIYSPGMEKFSLYRQDALPDGLGYNDVKTFCEESSGNIWIGTDGGGLDLFLRDQRIFRHYVNDPYNEHSLGSNAVLDVMQDRKGQIWVSTWGGGLNLFDKKSGRFTRFLNNPSDPHSISSNFVQKTFEDYMGNLWVATYYGGLNIFDVRSRQFTRVVDDPTGSTHLTGKNIVSLMEDREGRIWIGTDDGGLNCYHQGTHHFSHYFSSEEWVPDIRVLFQDSKGRVWVGQKGLYLLEAGADSFRVFTVKGGLSNEFIKGITEDEQGNLWISSSNGLTQLNPETLAFKKYNTGDGLQDLEFEANAFLRAKDGEMYFGGINGFNSFYPSAIRANGFVPPVYITGMQIAGKKEPVGDKEIVLSYRQSTFSLSFAALNFTTSENNQYAYRLEGLDKDWNYIGKESKVMYTNLGPGSYVFRVKASNNDGVWNEEGASVRIVITPPFWRTDWFIGLLVLVGVGCLYGFYRFRTNVRMRAMEARKREEIREEQMKFFTNVSHEFRTPLSLILGPLERIMKENPLPALTRHYQSMHRNAQRMLSLINELMDFGKLESGALKLGVQRGSLDAFMDEIAEEFRDWAVQKEIDFSLGGMEVREAWFDRQVLEKVVLNLLHNSFKYTNPGGRIVLEVLGTLDGWKPSFAGELILKNKFRGSSYAYVRVADTGIGISSSSIHHLFERYYRITESHLGSGVGLAFVKSLALLHKGDIYVYSEREKGTEIIIGIPIGESDYRAGERRDTAVEGGVRLEGYADAVVTRKAAAAGEELPPVETILLVEDNEELRSFLRESLSGSYQVMVAADGREGLAMAREISPSLIVSDVIMPGMNGVELCRAIKSDIDTCHIPFLMLTARTAQSAQVEGLDAGADYYFSKPLNTQLLLLTIRNRLEQDRRLKQRYKQDSHVEAMELVHSEKDKEFMASLLSIIDAGMSNPEFDVDSVCQAMGMSRTRLYQKVKGISQQSIGDFIRTQRLRKALQIMTHEDVSLTEVMARIGIQTQSYFTKAFKKEFGKTPTQYMQELRKY